MSRFPALHRAEAAVAELPGVGIAAAPAVEQGRRQRPPRPFDRPRFLAVFAALVYVYLFAPIVVVFVFSFNSKRSTQIFGSFSLTWYQQLFNDQAMKASLTAEHRDRIHHDGGGHGDRHPARFRPRPEPVPAANRPTDVLMLLNLKMSPEIVTAIALLLVFTQLGLTLSLTTVILGHITLLDRLRHDHRPRTTGDLQRTEVEESGPLDLGATNFVQAIRLRHPPPALARRHRLRTARIRDVIR